MTAIAMCPEVERQGMKAGTFELTQMGIFIAGGTNILRLAALIPPDMTVYDAELAGWKIERKSAS